MLIMFQDLNELNKKTDCTRIMGETSPSEVIDIKVKDNEKIKIDNIELTSMHTPGIQIVHIVF